MQAGARGELEKLFRREMDAAGAELWLRSSLADLRHDGTGFVARVEREGETREVRARNLVLATGGKSIPKMGATGLAYDIAARFGLEIVSPRAGLVPFTFPDGRFSDLSGLSLPVRASNDRAGFDEAMLFTHRGLSGPAILQLSSYWAPGEAIRLDLLPGADLAGHLKAARETSGRKSVGTVLGQLLPARLVGGLDAHSGAPLATPVGALSDKAIAELASRLASWELTPQGTEGWSEDALKALDLGLQHLDLLVNLLRRRDADLGTAVFKNKLPLFRQLLLVHRDVRCPQSVGRVATNGPL